MQGIYKIKNLINGKCYVGQSVDIEKRWKTHKKDANYKNGVCYNYPLYRSIRKNGFNNFEFSILEIVEHQDDLTPRELYWYYKIKPNYNQVIPDGIDHPNSKSVYQIDIDDLSIIAKHKNISLYARENGLSRSTISGACRREISTAYGYYWCYVEDFDNWNPRLKGNQGKPVIRIKENEQKEYTSIKAAARENQVDGRTIQKVCLGKRKSAGGYVWKLKG